MGKRSFQSKLDIRLGRPGNRVAKKNADIQDSAIPAETRHGEIGNKFATPDNLLTDPELSLFDEDFLVNELDEKKKSKDEQ